MTPTPAEIGFAPAPLPADPSLPPGGGRFATPHAFDFGSVFNSASRTYFHYHDEALRHSRENALAMRRDDVIMRALRARQMPTAQLSWHLEPDDEENEAEADAAVLVTEILEAFPRFQQFRLHLLEALWYGRYGAYIRYQWDGKRENRFRPDKLRCVPTGHRPVNGDKLRFKWDGTPGVLVNGTYTDPDAEQVDFGRAVFLRGTRREGFVVHRFEAEDADYFEADLAGAINGVGIRGRLYWLWYLKSQILAQLLNYVERFASGLTVYYYDASNPQARAEMQSAIEAQQGNSAILIPRWANSRDTNSVDRLEFGSASPALLQNLVESYFDERIELYILGQALMQQAAPSGFGSGVAEAHSETLSRILKYDAISLQETLQTDLIDVLYRYNCPGITPARFLFDIDTPNATEVLGNAQIMHGMGLEIDADHLYTVTGQPKPAKGSAIASKMMPLSPSGLEQGPQPTGVPAAGQPLTDLAA